MPTTRSHPVKCAVRGNKTARRQKIPGAPAEIGRMIERLSGEDLKLSMPLLDAAVSGVVLGFNPDDAPMRRLAAKSWKRIRSLLSRHLLSEDQAIFPWTDAQREFPRAKLDKFKRRHEELRSLVQMIDSIDFETGAGAEVAKAGKALCRLAVRLDDLIEGEERELLPVLRRFMTGSEEVREHAPGC